MRKRDRSAKKLKLERETLRKLDRISDDALGKVQGGNEEAVTTGTRTCGDPGIVGGGAQLN